MHINNFDVSAHIRSVPGWPEPHVVFRDICSLLEDRRVFKQVIDLFVERYRDTRIDAVVGIDARGFIIGSPMAYLLDVGFIPIRKKASCRGPPFPRPTSWNTVKLRSKSRPPGSDRGTTWCSLTT